MSLGKNKSKFSQAFARPVMNGGLTDEQRKQLAMQPLLAPPLIESTPIKNVPPKEEVVTPAVPVNVPKFSGFGNKLAQMGGFNKIMGEKDLSAMTQEEVNKYQADRLQSRNRGTQDLLMALGSAFKGEDIVGSVQNLRDRRNTADDLQAQEDLNKQISEAYASGDYDLVNQLMLQKGDGAGIQAISNKINRDQPGVSDDGKFKLEYDDMGNVISMTPIQENIDALKNTTLGTADAKRVLDDTVKARTIGSKIESIDGFLKNIEDGELEFGVLDGVLNTMAESGIGVTDQEAINSREFKNFRNGLVTDLLNLQTGTKTDFDWKSLSEELQSVKTTEGVKDWLLKYQEKLDKEQEAIEDERSLYLDIQGKNNPFRTKPKFLEDVEVTE